MNRTEPRLQRPSLPPRSVLAPLVGVVTLATLSVVAFNAAIRAWIRAPKIDINADPATYGLPFSDVLIPTVNNKQLHGWFIPARGCRGDQQAPTLIVMHGWGANSEMMLPLADPFYHAGYALLIVNARNHGRSERDARSSAPHFAEDLESALDWLLQQPNVDRTKIGLIGHSNGAAASLLVASRRKEIAAVVSLASFAHPERVMRRYLESKSVPFVPLGWYALGYIQRITGSRFSDIAPEKRMAEIDCPVLIAHGIDDPTVPVNEAHRLHAESRKETTRLLLVEGTHEDYEGLKQRVGEVLDFVADAMGLRPAPNEPAGTQSGAAMPASSVFSSPL